MCWAAGSLVFGPGALVLGCYGYWVRFWGFFAVGLFWGLKSIGFHLSLLSFSFVWGFWGLGFVFVSVSFAVVSPRFIFVAEFWWLVSEFPFLFFLFASEVGPSFVWGLCLCPFLLSVLVVCLVVWVPFWLGEVWDLKLYCQSQRCHSDFLYSFNSNVLEG